MNHVRAAVLPGPGQPMEVREVPLPDLDPGEAILRTTLSEVCGTDVHLSHGRLAGVPYPIIPGHVSVGVLVRIRGTVTDVEGRRLREGDRVTFLDVHRTCHACWYCLVAKASTRCPHRKVYGITYGLQDGLTGGWAEAVHLKEGVRIIPLGQLPFERFMAGGCALPTALHAVELGEVRFADTVLVLGAGPVGLAAAHLARLRGAGRVLVVGAPAGRLEAAAAMGVKDTLDFTQHPFDARETWVRERTGGRGADVVIEATGSAQAVVDAMRLARQAGTVVVVGQYLDHGDVAFNPHLDLNAKHLTVRGCWGSDYSHFHRGAAVMADDAFAAPWEAMQLTRFGLSNAAEALDAVASGSVVKALIDPSA